ncbi:MAG: hypothetical protein H7329_15420 [Opitutaceae bacterium]|nr:hypothetical protein [Cytophagales bacterium]
MFPIIKSVIFTLILSLLFSEQVFSCNGGCPSGGGYLGIVPQFSRNFVGIRYRMRSFTYSDPAITSFIPSQHRFETVELWGRFYPAKRVQAFVFVPFQMNQEQSDATYNTQGIGDISFTVNYTIINTGDSIDKSLKHTLLLGIGAKLPTGKYQQRNISKQMFPITFQPGTGAYSGIGSVMYTIRFKKTGLSTNVSYYYNGKNELEYSFGNMLSANTSLFYWLKAGQFSFLPNIGTYIEQTGKDIENGYYIDNTGGSILYGSAGLDIYFKRLALSLNFQTPYSQNLPLRNQTKDLRLLTSLVCLF